MELQRLFKYYYLKFIRLRGEPHDLALGMAFGIFAGMMPIIPFHMALALALALIFKGSKITAVLGAWVSNPLTWYFLYFFNYKLGSIVLGFSGDNKIFAPVMESVKNSGETLDFLLKITSSSGIIVAAFLIGGLIMGIVASIPSYFIFLKIFQWLKVLRHGLNQKKSQAKDE